jgi:thiamine phosphate synthase YjbQ (UPF0047 family)
MSKSSTVTVREKPVEDVASATVGGLTIHGETFVVRTDQRIELVDLTNRIMEFVRTFNISEGLVSLWSMHTTCTLFINDSSGAAPDIKRFLEQMVARDAEIHAQRSEPLDCDRHERRLAPARDAARPQPDAADQRREVCSAMAAILMAELDGRARDRVAFRSSASREAAGHASRMLRARHLLDIADKLDAGSRSTLEDGVRLFEAPTARRRLAREPRAREAPRRAHLLQLQHPASRRPTSASRAACSARSRGSSRRRRRLHDVARAGVGQAAQRAHQPLTEIHVVNGLHPDLPFDYYTELLRGFKRSAPTSI